LFSPKKKKKGKKRRWRWREGSFSYFANHLCLLCGNTILSPHKEDVVKCWWWWWSFFFSLSLFLSLSFSSRALCLFKARQNHIITHRL